LIVETDAMAAVPLWFVPARLHLQLRQSTRVETTSWTAARRVIYPVICNVPEYMCRLGVCPDSARENRG